MSVDASPSLNQGSGPGNSFQVARSDETFRVEVALPEEGEACRTLEMKDEYFEDYIHPYFPDLKKSDLVPDKLKACFRVYPKENATCSQLFVHGWNADGDVWHPVAEYESKDPTYPCKNITVDVLGYGDSSASEEIKFENPLASAMFIIAMTDVIISNDGVDKIALAGHSKGGGESALVALLASKLFFDVDLFSPYTEEVPLGKLVKKQPWLVTEMGPAAFLLSMELATGVAGKPSLRDPVVQAGLLSSWLRHENLPPPGEISRPEVRVRTANMDWSALHYILDNHPELIEELKRNATISIARGTLDTVVPRKGIEEFAAKMGIDKREIKVFHGARHHPIFIKPKKVNAFRMKERGRPEVRPTTPTHPGLAEKTGKQVSYR